MNFSIPVYVEQQKGRGSENQRLFVVRPLFAEDAVFEVRGEQLSRVLTRLTGKLHSHLQLLARLSNHRALAQFAYAPPTRDRLLDIKFEAQKETVRGRLLFVELDALGETVAFTPSRPDLWFTLDSGRSLRDRAEEFFTSHFRREKDAGPKPREVDGKAWLASVDVDISLKQEEDEKPQQFFALIQETQKPDGTRELHRTGRCLNHLFPDELDRVLFRDDESATLGRILDDKNRRPVLLVGPRGVGKTALIHEYVYRVAALEKKGSAMKARNVWLLSPQRLISGMSYVGEWEGRLLAILETAKKKDHILYFDDLIGLFDAGVTSQSNVSVAQLLKHSMEKRHVRVLGEMTPEAFRVLQETDRGFADMFHVIPLRESLPEFNCRILIRVIQQFEARHQTRFAADVLPAVIDLQQRYVRDIVFPGKAAVFLKQLAVKFKNAPVTRQVALQEFQEKSGLSLSFLDDRQKLQRSSIVGELSKKIIGQPNALAAFADVVCLAKARLNDPHRPLASFLFVGPTGVGKTQCAKALAEYLFGSADKLIRFDLNEYVDPLSAARLTGTPRQPEGHLTSAVRRLPFSVILLDEVEKADPGVLDLLLQVLGEGRLTDARGRTADFTNSIIIMTSNLGVREASSTAGLKKADSAGDPSIFVRAAETFFRPELFNRLDRVIPFERLGRAEVRSIAELLIKEMFKREGLLRRRCVLQIHPAAMERVVDEGYHPTLGARALRRALEKQLAQPTATHLAASRSDSPTVISLYPSGAGIAVHVQILNRVAQSDGVDRLVAKHPPATVLDRSAGAVSRLGELLLKRRPPGTLAASDIRPEHHVYFSLRELLERIQHSIERTREGLQPKKSYRPVRHKIARARSFDTMSVVDLKGVWASIFSAADLHEHLKAAATDNNDSETARFVLHIARQTALLEASLNAEYSRAILLIRPVEIEGASHAKELQELYVAAFAQMPGLDATVIQIPAAQSGQAALLLEGPCAQLLAEVEAGTHLFFARTMRVLQVMVVPLKSEEANRALEEHWARRELWLSELAAGRAAAQDDPFLLGPVIRIYDEKKSVLDVRSGTLTAEAATSANLSDLILARLPVATELKDLG